MKHSIRTKITLLLSTMIILTIFITWFINLTFLPGFYLQSKKDNLDEAYHKISDVIVSMDDATELTDDQQSTLEKYEQDYDIDIFVKSGQNTYLYPIISNIGENDRRKIEALFQDASGFGSPDIEKRNLLEETNDYYIYSYSEKKLATNFINLVGVVDEADQDSEVDKTISFSNSSIQLGISSSSLILIRTNLESIDKNVAVANEFLAYVGILAALIGSIAMFLISKSFTKPIKQLSGIAKKMSDLDFEVKYKGRSKDEIGELGNSINTLSDKLESTIMELKQANNELTTDIQRKTEIDEMRKEFLSNVSHELKTPIALIQGYAEGLKENINDDEESRDFYCEVIMDEANKMNSMVKKLLSLNELEFGNNQINFDRFDIVALIRSVISATEILFKQKEAVLHFEQTEPIYVWADELLIEQVVTNYISNALNHVSGQKIIEIKLIPRGDTIRVAVFNTGEQIPEDELDKIWIKFYKVDKARTREYGGSGIGLSIVKAIMNSHNKECGAINRPIGVEFWFELDTKS